MKNWDELDDNEKKEVDFQAIILGATRQEVMISMYYRNSSLQKLIMEMNQVKGER